MALTARIAVPMECYWARQCLGWLQRASSSPTQQQQHQHRKSRQQLENTLGQKFVVDAVLWADIAKSGRTDRLDDTLDYRKIFSEIQQVVEGPAKVLQEAVAEEAAQRLLALDGRVSAVQLYIRKPHVALPSILDSIGIEILRRRTT
ncbi:hypothetical protein COO60DRAFT_1529536 [Scenedesmus sp. NREL 46B-D3]|nr:hypothetical protein COO60DRAFT_1529536 [Scenedesmus sp. NREL 46B-D3]